MTSIVAIVGRPNVGKSSIFNLLTGSNIALVADFSGLTRDRQYGKAKGSSAILIDTGGISSDSSDLLASVLAQTEFAIQEADFLLFVVDCKDGLLGLDNDISKKLRKTNKPIYLIINKVDGQQDESKTHEFSELGLKDIFIISVAHNKGMGDLSDLISEISPPEELNEISETRVKIAVIGRPNVGKSTLINQLSGGQRVLVSPESGTTRDSIEVPITNQGKEVILVDTAGIRRKRSVSKQTEKFSVGQSIEAIRKSNVVIHLVDSEESLVDQDMHLLGLALSLGRPVILAPNKIDLLVEKQIEDLKNQILRKLRFAKYIHTHLISAKTGLGVKSLINLAQDAYFSSSKDLNTALLNKILISAIKQHPPPLKGRFRPKLRYAHQGGRNPPVVIIHGNNLKKLSNSYKKYIENYFREEINFKSTPLVVEFLEGKNPFKVKPNRLSVRQKKKRTRVVKQNKRQ